MKRTWISRRGISIRSPRLPSAIRRPASIFCPGSASWIGLTLDRHWPEAKRRKFLKQAGRLYDLRGTREGLWRELLLFLEMDDARLLPDDQPRDRCRPAPANCAPPHIRPCAWQPPPLILEHFKLRRWLFLGAGRLGDQAVLWGKRIVNRSQLDDERAGGAHAIADDAGSVARSVSRLCAQIHRLCSGVVTETSDTDRKALENLLRNGAAGATPAQVEYVEPRFRIGFQSMIGFDSVVGALSRRSDVERNAARSQRRC